jgi:hypothetical protein
MADPDPERILAIIKYHLDKVLKYNPYYNFKGIANSKQFCELLGEDPAFCHFGFNDERYVTARVGGNLVTSLHRKLGDMYEEIFKYLLKLKFALADADLNFAVDVPIGGRIQKRSTDGIVRTEFLEGIKLSGLRDDVMGKKGLGFEVRSCYQIGDSKRIQADWDMALALEKQGFIPIMLIFCSTSLRSPCLRLSKSWNLFEGKATFEFIEELTGFDLYGFFAANHQVLSLTIDNIFAKL